MSEQCVDMSKRASDTIEECYALYDYDYVNKHGDLIQISEGERYYVLDKTNNDWWHVRSQLTYQNLYVPAQYVHIIKSDDTKFKPYISLSLEPGHRLSGLSHDHDYGGNTPPPDYAHDSEQDDVSLTTPTTNTHTVYKRSCSHGDDEYANLDAIRAVQHRIDSPEECNDDYVNISSIQPSSNAPPRPEPRNFVRAITDHWQLYQDPHTHRHYYFNSLTLERTWKPPRIDQWAPRQTETADHGSDYSSLYCADAGSSELPFDQRFIHYNLDASANGDKLLYNNIASTTPNTPNTPNVDGWSEKTNAHGDPVYTNDATNEKWLSSVDEETGRLYFYKEGTIETSWTLPPASMSASLHVPNDSSHVDQLMNRSSKSRSLYVANDKLSDNIVKAQTLPSLTTLTSFNSGKVEDSAKPNPLPSFVTTQVFLQSYHYRPNTLAESQGPKDGYLNKTKVLDGGKKVKKNWSASYVLLTGSNLVFYKDQKSAQPKAGYPHGRPEFMISLHGASVQFDPRDKSSKKNVIMLTTTAQTQYLLQCDDYFKIHNWYIALNETLQMLNHGLEIPTLIKEPDRVETDTVTPQTTKVNKTSVSRSQSMNNSSDEGLSKIRLRLRQFMSRRPTADALKARGIIKDAVFGADLKQLSDRDHSSVPKFVRLCVATIEERGLDIDGLYRLSGNVSAIQKLRHMIDQDQWQALSDPLWDIHVLTGTLKLFFRELKEPLFPYEFYDKFVAAVQLMPTSARLKTFRDILHSFPKCNAETVKFLFGHFVKVTDQCKENRMEPHNLAIVFGPTLLWPLHRTSQTMAVSTVYQTRIIEFLLLEYTAIYR